MAAAVFSYRLETLEHLTLMTTQTLSGLTFSCKSVQTCQSCLFLSWYSEF